MAGCWMCFQIMRVQNPEQWEHYCKQRHTVEASMVDESLPVQWTLYRGVDKETAKKICKKGSNQGISGDAHCKYPRVWGVPVIFQKCCN